MLRKLLDFRSYLIVTSILLAMILLCVKAYCNGLILLEMPHIEGGVEVTVQNIINDMERDRQKEEERIRHEIIKKENETSQDKEQYEYPFYRCLNPREEYIS